MKSKKKKKKPKATKQSTSAFLQLKNTVKRFDFKRLLALAATFIPVFILYQIGIFFTFKPIIHIYSWITFLLLIAFFILNRGFGKKPDPTSDENLPKDLNEEEKAAYVASEKLRLKYSRVVLLLLTSFLITLLIDSIYLVYFQWFKA